ncbi:MAG: D-glycero-beta-D-manno-heptose 1,7-bisphosphate 7-phosphatase [Gammaproteobacteria bacterium]
MSLIILDRDGVINYDSDAFIKSPAEWHPIPGSLEAIARLNQAGSKVVVASNQSGIARGLFDLNMLNQIHKKMQDELAQVGGVIETILFCPHAPEDSCDCRKPRPGLLLKIAQQFNRHLTDVPAVGDSLRDIQAALAVGARPILVRTGKGLQALREGHISIDLLVCDDLAGVVDVLLGENK